MKRQCFPSTAQIEQYSASASPAFGGGRPKPESHINPRPEATVRRAL
jgi:hypothetical protein